MVLEAPSSATVDYNGTISKTSSGRVIDLQGESGGTVSFDGSVSCTPSCGGIFLHDSGATIGFTGVAATSCTNIPAL